MLSLRSISVVKRVSLTNHSIFQKNRLFSLQLDRDNVNTLNDKNSDTIQSQSSSTARPKLRVKNILEAKQTKVFTISDQSTVDQAISHLTVNEISASLAVDSKTGEVSGIFTARDILRYMHKKGGDSTYKTSKEKSLQHKISEFMVPKTKLLFCGLNDTALQARQIMSQSKIRHIPVIEGSEVLG